MIRSTNKARLDLISHYATRQTAEIQKLTAQIASGQRVQKPSDAPADIGVIQRVEAAKADQDKYKSNASYAQMILDTADGALARVANQLTRLKELTVQASNGTASASSRQMIGSEVGLIRDGVLDAANTKVDGRYIFAGTKYDAPAFDRTSGAYQGTMTEASVQVAANRDLTTSFVGSQVFTSSVDIPAMVQNLTVALNTNDATGISNALSQIDAALSQIGDWRARVGGQQRAVEDVVEMSESLSTTFATHLSGLTEINQVETYTKLSMLQSAYQSTLQVAASSNVQSLFDMLN